MKETIIKAIEVALGLVDLAGNFTIPTSGLAKVREHLVEALRELV